MHSPDISTESISSVPLPISHDLDSDSDDDEEGADGETWHARAGTLSGASMDDEQRIQLLRASNDELARKLRDLEDTLQRRLAEHEDELQEMTIRLEDLKSELSSVRRDEKELRAKEVSSYLFVQIFDTEFNYASSVQIKVKSQPLRRKLPGSRRHWITQRSHIII
jgi:chromosome segregation ATPase